MRKMEVDKRRGDGRRATKGERGEYKLKEKEVKGREAEEMKPVTKEEGREGGDE